MVVGILATNGEVTLPDRIGEDKLRGPEIVRAVGVALDEARLCAGGRTTSHGSSRCLLCGAAWCLCLIEEPVNVQIDTQLAQFTIIIGVENVLAEVVVLPDMAL